MIGAYPGYDGQQRKMARVYFENSASQVAPSDIYSRAVTLGKTADIYQARGQLDEALRILKDEQLPESKAVSAS